MEQEGLVSEFKTALQQKSDVENQLRDLLRSKHNEVQMLSTNSEALAQQSHQQVLVRVRVLASMLTIAVGVFGTRRVTNIAGSTCQRTEESVISSPRA